MAKSLREQINLKKVPGTDNTYLCDWHSDWAVGINILKLHLEFLKPCTPEKSTITIKTLRSGATSTTLQAELTQSNQLKTLAIATAVNFERPLGPSAKSEWTLLPLPTAHPNLHAIESGQKDPNWVLGRIKGEFLKFTERILFAAPRKGHTTNGIHDGWYKFLYAHNDDEDYSPDYEGGVDNTLLTFLTDAIPSMSDMLLRNGGAYDAHAIHRKMLQWEAADRRNEGKPAVIWNTIKEAMKAQVFNNTVTLDIEFKKRVDPKKNSGWVFIRTVTKMMDRGRMDLDIVICDETMELLAIAHQTVLVLEAGRKFSKVRKAAL
ncbi:thioesterase-like superfamily-domain-containing protein [Triangularia verruculosa]|uniref:Thioesterase-like superfamily-domain-containing protein n=1 Tax=Triangularia verruculosa TaxID=2587418 RepID=A0AAN6XII7_9PEZI|nr:thioesterase-like superfamily-domain-containing protein [Triangularia verruculosa]